MVTTDAIKTDLQLEVSNKVQDLSGSISKIPSYRFRCLLPRPAMWSKAGMAKQTKGR